MNYCMKFSEYKEKITPIGIEKEWVGKQCEDINKNNDCSYFESSLKKWLGIF